MAIAHSGLCHLGDERLRVAQEQELHLTIAMELLLEALADQTVSVPRTLHDRPARRGFTAHELRDAYGAVIAPKSALRRGTVVELIQQRHDGVGREINMA